VRRQALLGFGPIAAIAAAAWVALRVPDLGQTAVFFTASNPTLSAAEAAMATVAWALIVAALCIGAVSLVGQVRRSRIGRSRNQVAWMLLAAGVTILVVGGLRHSWSQPVVCCGSGSSALQEAVQLAR
jgi:hypothetical protein